MGYLKFMFSKKATKFDEIFTVDLTLCSKCQIDGADLVNFCGLLRKRELYHVMLNFKHNCQWKKFSKVPNISLAFFFFFRIFFYLHVHSGLHSYIQVSRICRIKWKKDRKLWLYLGQACMICTSTKDYIMATL